MGPAGVRGLRTAGQEGWRHGFRSMTRIVIIRHREGKTDEGLPVNVSLTPRLEAFVRRKVASGLYNNASEVIREGLRLLLERDAQAQPASPPDKARVRDVLSSLEGALRQKGITSLALFGSIVPGGANAESDIDILVDIDPEAHFSLVDLVAVKDFLQAHLGCDVDLVTRDGADPAILPRILRDAERVF